jgi:hypothetical protein
VPQLRIPARIGVSPPPPESGAGRARRRWYVLIAGCALIALLAGLQMAAEIRSWMDSGLGPCGCRPRFGGGGALVGRGGVTVVADVAVIVVAGLGAGFGRRRIRQQLP